MAQKQEKAWFQDWFNSPYYGVLYQHRNDDEARFFIHNLIQQNILLRGAKVLDLACGNGRHAKFLLEEGLEVTGMDLSESQITEARLNSPENIAFFVGDMREFDLRMKFDVVLNLFTSFGYFDSKEENLRVLSCIAKHLHRDSIFILDYFNAEFVKASLPFKGETIKGEVTISYHKYALEEMVVKDIEVDDRGEIHHFREKVQLISRENFSNLLDEAGFEVLHTFGNYSLEPFSTETSDRLILIAKPR
jgi:SAM-dependent methyltransferase